MVGCECRGLRSALSNQKVNDKGRNLQLGATVDFPGLKSSAFAEVLLK